MLTILFSITPSFLFNSAEGNEKKNNILFVFNESFGKTADSLKLLDMEPRRMLKEKGKKRFFNQWLKPDQ